MMRRRIAALALTTALATAALAGCSSEGSNVDCNLNSCTVTMDRGVDASASVLGVDVKLQSVQNQQVTLDVEGNTVTVPVGPDGSTQVAGLTVTVQSISDSQVVLQITGGGN